MIGRIQDSETAVDTRFPGESGAVAGRVPVVAEIHNCGCVTSHTPEGYLTEAVFCPEALPIERERLVLRRVQRQTELEDPRMDELIPALEAREAALEAHRRGPGSSPRQSCYAENNEESDEERRAVLSTHLSIVELLETPDAFRDWLHTKKPLEVVGEKGSNRCPLAQFLRSHRPETRCEVGRNHFWVAWGRPVELPGWASAFVHSADDLMSSLGPRPRVYATDALDLLDESSRLCLSESG